MCLVFIALTTSGSNAQMTTSRPAPAATCAKAVPQAPAPSTPTFCSGDAPIESFIEYSGPNPYRCGMDQKVDTRDRILHAATERIKHYGYNKTTMAEIAADCRMSPGNIYRFFEAKIDIAEAMSRQHAMEQNGRLSAIARRKTIPADKRL